MLNQIRTIASKSNTIKTIYRSVTNFKLEDHYIFTKGDKDISLIGVCFSKWLGVKRSTHALFGNVLEIDNTNRDDYTERILGILKNYSYIIFSGLPPYSERYIRSLKGRYPEKKIYVLYHGSPSQHVDNIFERKNYELMFKLNEERLVEEIIFVKEELNQMFELLGIKSRYLPNKVPEFNFDLKKKISDLEFPMGKKKIGIFTQNLGWWKNPFNQFIAALGLEDTMMYINHDLKKLGYMERYAERFVDCDIVSDLEQFVNLLAKMDVNLYVTLTECYPMHALYSMAVDVPCILGNTTKIYQEDPYLYEKLVVKEMDNPYQIYKQLKDVLENLTEVKQHLSTYRELLKAKNAKMWEDFYLEVGIKAS